MFCKWVNINNLIAEYMSMICCIIITIYDENYPKPENIPVQQKLQQGNSQEGG